MAEGNDLRIETHPIVNFESSCQQLEKSEPQAKKDNLRILECEKIQRRQEIVGQVAQIIGAKNSSRLSQVKNSSQMICFKIFIRKVIIRKKP